MQCFAAWVCSCDGLCRTQIPRNSLFKLHAGTAGTVQPLDWTFTWNAIYAEQVWSWLRAGAWPFLHASWSCFEELCGRAFSTAYVTSLCLRSVSGSAVWIQTWRAPCPHSGTTRFSPSFQWISAPVFFALAASKVLWLRWVLAQVLDTLKVCNRFVHKLSWPSTWDGQHFGNHLSCPCATCALNLAWIDCHYYRRGMNRYRSPRVVPTKILDLLPRLFIALVLWHRSTTWLAMVCFHY